MKTKKDVLLVDDDHVTAAVIQHILAKEGFLVRCARDGKEALDAIRSRTPDIILTDLVMPKIGGEELIRIVRQMPDMDDVIIVVVTGTILEKDQAACSLPADAIIPKLPPESMHNRILKVFREIKESGRITTRLQAETVPSLPEGRIVKELLALREYQDAVFEKLSEGLVLLDIDFKIIKVNDMAAYLLHKNRADLMGHFFSECFADEDRKQVGDLLTGLFSKKDPEYEKKTVIHKNRTLDLKLTSLVDPITRKAVAGIVLIENITERKDLEKRLRASEKQYRDIVNTVPDIIYHLDAEGRFLFVNFAVKELGYTCEELLGQSFLSIVHPDDAQKAKLVTGEKRIRTRKTRGIELRLLPKETKDGRIYNVRNVPVLITARGLYDVKDHDIQNPLKRYIGTQGLAEDITDRKKMEMMLIKAKKDWERTFDAITDMVFLLDKERRIVRVNKATIERLCMSRQQIIGRQCREIMDPKSHPVERCPIAKTVRDNLPHTQEIEDTNLGGFFICSSSPILDEQGNILGYTNSLKDITERKRLESQFQEAQKMEAVGTLAGGIAHDFNNVLMGIQGYASLMLMQMDPVNPHFPKLKKIEAQVGQASELTRQLLGFARGGKYVIGSIDINELVAESAEMFGETKKEITVHARMSEDTLTIEGDRTQIEQVLLNLYVNAWQAMPGGGDLSVETNPVVIEQSEAKIHEFEPGRYARISVSDKGVGMDQKTQARIFEPFFTTKEMGRGTGLGLASVYGIVKNHNGVIEVESEPGKGSSFHIYFPTSEKALEKDKEGKKKIMRGTETILLIDDEEIILDVASELLATLGYTVIKAKSGKEAVDSYRRKSGEIDLVILDMIMPKMGGGKTYDLLKGINPEIKCILSSGYSIDKDAKEIMARGITTFMQKPFDIAVLSQKITDALAGSKKK
jgi:PAS domain S-box-containing protein